MRLSNVIDFIMSLPNSLVDGSFGGCAKALVWYQTYFAITIILSLVGWTGLARVVRGKLIALREEDFVVAAKVSMLQMHLLSLDI